MFHFLAQATGSDSCLKFPYDSLGTGMLRSPWRKQIQKTLSYNRTRRLNTLALRLTPDVRWFERIPFVFANSSMSYYLMYFHVSFSKWNLVKLFAILIYHIFGFTSAASDKHYIKIRSGNTCHTWDLSGLHCASLAQPVWKIAGNTSERSTLLFWQTTYICYCLFRTLSILNCLAPSPFPV